LAGAAEAANLIAHAAVTQTLDQRWRVAIDLSGSASGHRTLTADSCVQLARASALIIALAANPEAALDLSGDDSVAPQSSPRPLADAGTKAPSASAPTPPDSAPSASLTKPDPSTQPPSLPQTSIDHAPQKPATDEPASKEEASVRLTPRPKSGWALFAQGGLEKGSLPTSTAWIGIGVRHQARKLPLGFALSSLLTQGTSARYDNGVGADFRFFATNAVVCLQPHAKRWLFASCLGARIATTHAEGHLLIIDGVDTHVGGAEIFTRYRWSIEPVAMLMLGYELFPSVSFELGATLAFPARSWEFVVDGVGTLYRASHEHVLLHSGVAFLL
jgi:hypothetical protein